MKTRSKRIPTILLAGLILLFPAVRAHALSSHLLLTQNGAAPNQYLGWDVAGGFDFNGDGHDDVAFGAPLYSGGAYFGNGRVYIHYGGPGYDAAADLVLEGWYTNALLGIAVAPAGDFNGDGWDDLIVSGCEDGMVYYVWVYFGGPGADTTPDWEAEGVVPSDNFGSTVAAAGDVNGDGYDDILVGARDANAQEPNAGRAYVYYGGASANGAPDLVFQGEHTGDMFGETVASAGDVNGDGYDDVVVGAPQYESYSDQNNGRLYLYLGGPGADNTADLVITGEYNDTIGYGLSHVDDFNHDGYGDILASGGYAIVASSNVGVIRVWFGGPGMDQVPDVTIYGNSGDFMGRENVVSGDFDADGNPDVAVTSWQGATVDAQTVRIYCGGPDWDDVPDLELHNPEMTGKFGEGLDCAGDFDGDGYDDLVIGDWITDQGYVYALYPYVVLAPVGGEAWTAGAAAEVHWRGGEIADIEFSSDGGASWLTLAASVGGNTTNSVTVTAPGLLTDLALVRVIGHESGATPGHVGVGAATFSVVAPWSPPAAAFLEKVTTAWSLPDQYHGCSCAPAGDFNGDGYDDYIVGSRYHGPAGAQAGAAFINYGGLGLDDVPDLVLGGESDGDSFGVSVARAGDVNGDGYDDVIVGASKNDVGAVDAGRAYVFFGGPAPDVLPDLVFTGEGNMHVLGECVAGVGDVNGDGYDDVAAGAYRYDDGPVTWRGAVYVYFGGPGADSVADLLLGGEQASEFFGFSVAGAGDVNGDGWDDLITGGAQYDTEQADAGRACVYFGGPDVDDVPDIQIHGRNAHDWLGQPVAGAGDLNGDGYGDFLVGVNGDDTAAQDAGAVYVFHGGAAIDDEPDLILYGENASDYFPLWLPESGDDVNGDGYDDIAAATEVNDNGGNNTGRAYLWYGGPGLDATPDLILTGDVVDGRFGASVAFAGDVLGDGFGDILVGQPRHDGGRSHLFDGNRYHLLYPVGGVTWDVGTTATVRWLGAEPASVRLSVDGGASYRELAGDAGGGATNALPLIVPHQPTRFALIKIAPSDMSLRGEDVSDELFTIEASIALLALKADRAPEGGALITWETDPGPADLAGYRLARATGPATAVSDWQTLVDMTRETSYRDPAASAGSRYRLSGVNGLGEEYLLGETTFGIAARLAAWPLPYRGGDLNISFATAGGLGGGSGRSEVTIYDLAGRLVRTVARADYPAGYQLAVWDGRDDDGRAVSAGVYFLRAKSGGEAATRKLLVVR